MFCCFLSLKSSFTQREKTTIETAIHHIEQVKIYLDFRGALLLSLIHVSFTNIPSIRKSKQARLKVAIN